MVSNIKTLRDLTGAPLTACKEALNATNNDIDQAVVHLRERGLASMSKRFGNQTKEGTFGVYTNNQLVSIIELLCETDFVANNDMFQECANALAESLAEKNILSTDSVEIKDVASESILDKIMNLKENIKLNRHTLMTKEGGHVYYYIHSSGANKIAAAVKLSEEFAGGRDIAIHLASHDPVAVAVTQAEIPESVLAEAINPEMSDKAVQAMKKSMALADQLFIKDPSKTVQEYLGNVRIVDFARSKIGE